MEDEIIAAAGVPEECFTDAGFDLKGTRRPYRVPITNTDLEAGLDEHGTYVRVAFDLPRGAYATVVLREILGEEAVDSARTRPQEDSAREAGDDIR
jgi:tRNA pseudouridine13 synthase